MASRIIKIDNMDYYIHYKTEQTENGFGVVIRKFNECGCMVDQARADNLFDCEENAKEFVALLCKNIVTPCTLCDIVNDMDL